MSLLQNQVRTSTCLHFGGSADACACAKKPVSTHTSSGFAADICGL